MVRESAATARSQPVASLLTVLMVASMVLGVMLTTGRTVAAEEQVLASIDTAGTRTITVRAEESAGLTSDVLERIAHMEGIEWSGAFSAVMDATNALVPDGARVPVRHAYGGQMDWLGIPARTPLAGGGLYASTRALDEWGLVDAAGAVTLSDGSAVGAAGTLRVPDFLSAFEPLALVPHHGHTGDEPIGTLVVIAARPELVSSVSDAVTSVLGVDDPSKVTVETSESLADLRAMVQGQLGEFSRGLVLAILSLTGTLVAILLHGLVMMRRRDYGRRRALGAPRALIMALVLTRTGLLATGGVVLGTAVAFTELQVTGSAVPGLAFTAALGVLAVITALAAAVIPAFLASRREPIRELRVP